MSVDASISVTGRCIGFFHCSAAHANTGEILQPQCKKTDCYRKKCNVTSTNVWSVLSDLQYVLLVGARKYPLELSFPGEFVLTLNQDLNVIDSQSTQQNGHEFLLQKNKNIYELLDLAGYGNTWQKLWVCDF